MKNRKYIYTDYYVYVHKKATDGSVFYVGKGTSDRAWQKGSKRNKHWNRIARKHGVIVEIVEHGYQNWYAEEREKDLINFYGLSNLCNMTEGGESGGKGRVWTKESRDKLSKSKKGKIHHWMIGDKNPRRNKEVVAKMSNNRKGKPAPWMLGDKNHMHRPEMKAMMSLRCKGKKRPEITGKNHKLSRKVKCLDNGLVFDSIACATRWLKSQGEKSASGGNISSVCMGKLNKAYGYKWQYA